MDTPKIGGLLLMLGMGLVLLRQVLPSNEIVFTISVPTGIVLGVLGLVLLSFGKGVRLYEILQTVASMLTGDHGLGKDSAEFLEDLAVTIKEQKIPEEPRRRQRLASALKSLGYFELSPEAIEAAMRNRNARKHLARSGKLPRESIDELYFRGIANSDEQKEYLLRQDSEHRRFRKRFLVGTAVLVPVLLVTGFVVFANSKVDEAARNYHLHERFYTLIESRRLGTEDMDDVRGFIALSEEQPLSRHLTLARDILETVYVTGSPNAETWETAYKLFADDTLEVTNVPLPSVTQDGLLGRVNRALLSLIRPSAHVDDVKAAGYVNILKGIICARYTSFGSYDRDAIDKCALYFRRAIRLLPTSDIANNGVGVALKYRVQHEDSTSASTMRALYEAAKHFDLALQLSGTGVYRQAKYMNNQADLFLEVAKRALFNSSEFSQGGTFERPCEMFWEDIRAKSSNGVLPLLDTVESFLNAVKTFFPSRTPEFLITEAQYHSLKASYLDSNGDQMKAEAELDLSCHISRVAIGRGYRDTEIFHKDKRKMHCFAAFDLPWASGYLNTLRTIVGGISPATIDQI